MENVKKTKTLHIPMLELIITLAFLSLLSIFVLTMFVGANALELKARDISKATILAQNMAEHLKGYTQYEQVMEECNALYVNDSDQGRIYELYYSKDWEQVMEPMTYKMTIEVIEEYKDDKQYITGKVTIHNERGYLVIRNDEDGMLIQLPYACYQ